MGLSAPAACECLHLTGGHAGPGISRDGGSFDAENDEGNCQRIASSIGWSSGVRGKRERIGPKDNPRRRRVSVSSRDSPHSTCVLLLSPLLLAVESRDSRQEATHYIQPAESSTVVTLAGSDMLSQFYGQQGAIRCIASCCDGLDVPT
jgi:hypothetical protein